MDAVSHVTVHTRTVTKPQITVNHTTIWAARVLKLLSYPHRLFFLKLTDLTAQPEHFGA